MTPDSPFDPETDPEFQADLAQQADARKHDESNGFMAKFGKAAEAVGHWAYDLPKNITVGVMDAALNTADFVDEASQAMEANKRASDAAMRDGPGTSAPELPPINTQKFIPVEVRKSLADFREHLTKGDTTSDEVTQLIAQYLLPFAGYSKAIGGLKAGSFAVSVVKAGVAEALTSGTVLKPDDGRFMDLVQLGRHTEGKFGDALRFIAPDGSAANAFVDYVASRDGDTAMEGRFKNVIDNLLGAGVLGTAFYTTAKGLKLGRVALENFGQGPVGKAAQRGKIGFHGSQADFEAFDHSFIGRGAGTQAYGYGTYIAEDRGVGGSYRTAGGPRINTGETVIHAEEVDGEPITGSVKDLLLEAGRKGLEGAQAKSWVEKEIKTNAQEWGFKNRTEMLAGLELSRKWNLAPGKLYTVDLPDEHIAKMLDWDAPLSDQSESVKSGLRNLTDSVAGKGFFDEYIKSGTPYYKDLWKNLLAESMDESEISRALSEDGISGIKYLDSGSRAAGKGTRNYVVFDPKTIKILKKE